MYIYLWVRIYFEGRMRGQVAEINTDERAGGRKKNRECAQRRHRNSGKLKAEEERQHEIMWEEDGK
jgi:hypothetical protein